MAVLPYDVTTDVGKVRLTVGDTDTSDAVFEDEELEYFLTKNSSNIGLASADTLEAWAAKYAANADSEKIGDYAYTQKAVDKMLALAKHLREVAVSDPSADFAEMGLTDFSYRDIIHNRNLRSG